MYGVIEDKKDKKTYLVTEFVSLGDLTTFLKQRGTSLELKARMSMLIGIATGSSSISQVRFHLHWTGMNHIHNCKLVHQNLSTNNILLDTNYNIKLAGKKYFLLFHSAEILKTLDTMIFWQQN